MNKKSWLVLLIPFVLIAIALFFLPAQIPMQIGLDGSVSWYGSKYLLLFFGILPFLFYLKYRKK